MKKLLVLMLVVISLVLIVSVVPSVFATPPEEINGWFYWAPEDSPYNYCLFSVDDDTGAPDGFLQGCVIQPDAPGRAAHGTFYQFPIFPAHDPDNTTGECKYNLATFYVPGRGDVGDPRFVMNRCSGSLEGLHVTGAGEAGEFSWTGTYHYGP